MKVALPEILNEIPMFRAAVATARNSPSVSGVEERAVSDPTGAEASRGSDISQVAQGKGI